MRLIALNLKLAKNENKVFTMFHFKTKIWMEWKDMGASQFGSATQLLINLDPRTKTYKY